MIVTDWMRRHRPGAVTFGWLSGALIMQGIMGSGVLKMQVITGLVMLVLAIQARQLDRKDV